MTTPASTETQTAAASKTGRLQGKCAFVLGGSAGIGRAIALRFAEEGATVTIASRSPDSKDGGVPTHELSARTAGRRSTCRSR